MFSCSPSTIPALDLHISLLRNSPTIFANEACKVPLYWRCLHHFANEAHMAKTHTRSPSPGPEPSLLKRLKTGHNSSASNPDVLVEDPTIDFASNLFDPQNVQRLNSVYHSGEPFKHALVEKLFRDDLLQKVKDECLRELHFTEKETDIYKVRSGRP